MFCFAKIAQAGGLGVVAIGFIAAFPRLMNPKVFAAGVFLFIFGWILERFLLRR